ncbi:MAG: GTP-binding protein, partial [Ilumatobacteraceae bacterium]
MRVIATAGHVDHGKSSLVEALTGTNPDRWDEERRRGLTIDLGFAHTTVATADGTAHGISIVDVPGHVRFLRNMLAGVGGIDACMFVVAATEGWKPQSEEHLRILELLGVGHGIVVVTKRDLVDDEWLELQQLDIRDRLAGTFLDGAPMLPVSCRRSRIDAGDESAAAADGLPALRLALAELAASSPAAADRDRPRLWIDRVFAARGSGTVVTGTLTGGHVAVDQHLAAGSHAVRIRGIQSHGIAVDRIGPGNRVALNLAGVDHSQLHRGDAVVEPAQWRPTIRFDASLQVLGSLDHVVSRRGSYLAYIGSGEFPVRLRVLGAESIRPGGSGLVRLHLAADQPVPLIPGDRFVLRESGRDETIGGGEVLDVQPVRPASKAAPDRSVDRVVDERGWIDADELAALTGERRPPTIGHWVAAPHALDQARLEVLAAVDAADALGLDTASLDEQQRAVLATLPGVVVEAGRARREAVADPFAAHPFVAAARAGGCAPPDPAGVAPTELRELIRRRLLVERDGIVFHPDAIDAAAV